MTKNEHNLNWSLNVSQRFLNVCPIKKIRVGLNM